MTEINNKLKELRKKLNLTQQEFADRINTSRSNIAGYEAGSRVPSTAVMYLICREFNVNKNWLRNGVGDIFIETQEDYLNGLSQRYHLDDLTKSVLEGYLNLRPEHREVVKEYIFSMAEKYKKLQDVKSEIDQEVEAYRKELEAEAKGAAG